MEFCLVLGMEFHGIPWNVFHGIPWKTFSIEFYEKCSSHGIIGIIGIISMKNFFHGIDKKWSFHGIPWKTSS